jgi:drug/metabolite transporter (DMT)-like permease
MEMSTAYPMMRSLPILLTAAVTTLILGEPLRPLAIAGMAVVFTGCLLMPLKDFSHFKLKDYLNSRWFYIFIVACGTTGYTILDKLAQSTFAGVWTDLSKPVLSLTFYSTRSVCLTICLLLAVLLTPGELKKFKSLIRENPLMPILAGFFASLTYTTVLLAMNYVDNVSYVQVFRQLGLIFGMAGGIIILKERCSLPKCIGGALILIGLVMTVLKI